jgi:hypothetical protein
MLEKLSNKQRDQLKQMRREVKREALGKSLDGIKSTLKRSRGMSLDKFDEVAFMIYADLIRDEQRKIHVFTEEDFK